jgi:ribosomal protein S18 acetylase RimI-like enzyme
MRRVKKGGKMTTPEFRIIKSDDLSEISELQAKVWQDYFISERGLQVPLLYRTRQNLKYYLEKEAEGCFVAELDGKTVGCIFSHVWGSVGWFGPVEVASKLQNRGIGKELVTRSVQYLRSRGCTTIGLETMTSSFKNISLYEKLGFLPRHQSYVLFKRLHKYSGSNPHINESIPEDPTTRIKIWNSVIPGLDYTSEFHATMSHKLGKVLFYGSEEEESHAIVHTYEMFDNSPNAIVKMVVAGDVTSASALLSECENASLKAGKNGIFLRTYAATIPRLEFFLERGYIIQSTSTRMILEGPDEESGIFHVSCWSG